MVKVKRLRKQVVVITGASAGIGRAAVRAFAQHGARIGLLARGEERLRAAVDEARTLGGDALALPTDVADAAAVERAAAAVEEKFGPIDVWVNVAMTTILAPIENISAEEFKRATEVTYLGTVYGTMAALKRMRPRNLGAIVQVGSALSYRSIPLQAPYCGAKHAIRGFTDSLRCELLREGSRVHLTMVQLSAFNTPQFDWCKTTLPNHPQPVPPIFQPEVAAEAIVWASRHRRRELYVGWPAVKALWGNQLAPGLLDRYLARTCYQGQQTDQPLNDDRPINLWSAPDGDPGARGDFSDRALEMSWQLWFTTRRNWFALAGTAIAAAGALTWAKNRSGGKRKALRRL